MFTSKTNKYLGVGVFAATTLFSSFAMAQKAAEPTTATIEQVTALQRKVLVAELAKKLRDANAVDSSKASAGASAFPSAPVPGGAVVALPSPRKKTASAPVVPKEEVRVVSISGVGGNLNAILSDGNNVRAGSKFTKNGDVWEVIRINQTNIQFKQCAASVCKDVILPVSP